MLPNEPNENPNPELTDDEKKAAADKAAAEQKPSFVTIDQLASVTQALTSMQEQLKLIGQARQAPIGSMASTETVDPTDEEIVNELRDGKISGLKKLIRNTEERVRKNEVEPLKQWGINTIGELTKNLIKQDKALVHYNRFEKEIDAQLSQLAPEMRANPTAVRYAYNLVVGQHAEELIAEASKKAVEGSRGKSNDVLPGGSTSRGGESRNDDGLPSMADLVGVEAAESLKAMGRTPEQHARSMGFKTFADYARFIQDEKKAQETT